MKKRLIRWLLSRYCCVINLDDILTKDKSGRVKMIDGKEVDDAQLKTLAQEAKFIKETHLWRIMTHTVRKNAQKKMYDDSLSYDDMLGGKFILYTISILENILKVLT